jgi:pimeloyl-ACP methyl ester carboxylesterase
MNDSKRLIVIRHGIFSNANNMSTLQEKVEAWFPSATIDNDSYEWTEPVLWNGICLAENLVNRWVGAGFEHILLFGHSQGGLVCRVAVAAICERAGFERWVRMEPYLDSAYRTKALERLENLRAKDDVVAECAKHIRLVVMLATPNAGALTHGQMALIARAFLDTAKWFASRKGLINFKELTTDRLFRILQHLKVSKVKYLSISGSKVNRYSTFNHGDLTLIPGLSRLGLYLDRPNDLIVEDSSVDLRRSPLPSEIADLDQQYRHVRCYTDCLDVSHLSIHGNHEVFASIQQTLAEWGLWNEPGP